MTKSKLIKLIAVIIILVLLILVTGLLLPRSLDEAVWRYRTEPKHVTILRYDQNDLPAFGVTLDEARTAELMRQLKTLRGRYKGPSGKDAGEAAPAGYVLRLNSTGYGEVDFAGESGFVLAEKSGLLSSSWGGGKSAAYDLGNDTQAFFDLCDSYLDPDGGYPGRAFLQEFFSVSKDRWKIWELAMFSSDSGAMARAIEPYHAGLAPYVTPEILKRIELGRYLANMELSCMAEARSWQIQMIRVDEKSEPGSYNFWVDLCSTEEPYAYKTFSGSYVANGEGLIKNFYVDIGE